MADPKSPPADPGGAERKAKILELAERTNVKFMRLQFTDILGVIKNVEVPTGSSARRSTARSCSTARRSKASSGSRNRTCSCSPTCRRSGCCRGRRRPANASAG